MVRTKNPGLPIVERSGCWELVPPGLHCKLTFTVALLGVGAVNGLSTRYGCRKIVSRISWVLQSCFF